MQAFAGLGLPPVTSSPSIAPTWARCVEARVVPLLEGTDAMVYSLVAVVFLGAAFAMLGYSVSGEPARCNSAVLRELL
jgi:hypothetical protein